MYTLYCQIKFKIVNPQLSLYSTCSIHVFSGSMTCVHLSISFLYTWSVLFPFNIIPIHLVSSISNLPAQWWMSCFPGYSPMRFWPIYHFSCTFWLCHGPMKGVLLKTEVSEGSLHSLKHKQRSVTL